MNPQPITPGQAGPSTADKLKVVMTEVITPLMQKHMKDIETMILITCRESAQQIVQAEQSLEANVKSLYESSPRIEQSLAQIRKEVGAMNEKISEFDRKIADLDRKITTLNARVVATRRLDNYEVAAENPFGRPSGYLPNDFNCD